MLAEIVGSIHSQLSESPIKKVCVCSFCVCVCMHECVCMHVCVCVCVWKSICARTCHCVNWLICEVNQALHSNVYCPVTSSLSTNSHIKILNHLHSSYHSFRWLLVSLQVEVRTWGGRDVNITTRSVRNLLEAVVSQIWTWLCDSILCYLHLIQSFLF